MNDKNRNIRIVLGGSFNPPTIAHTALMLHAMRQVEQASNRVCYGVFVPSSHAYVSRKMQKEPDASRIVFTESDRMALLDASHNPLFQSLDIEYGDDGKGHTYKTLCRIREKYPDDQIMFLAGADKLRIIPKWRNAGKLLSEFTVLMTCRDEDNAEAMIRANPSLSKHISSFWLIPKLPAKYASISSTKARKAILSGDMPDTAKLCGWEQARLIEDMSRRILAGANGHVTEPIPESEHLKTALLLAGPEAVSDFIGRDARHIPYGDIETLIDDTMAQMPDEEIEKFNAKYMSMLNQKLMGWRTV